MPGIGEAVALLAGEGEGEGFGLKVNMYRCSTKTSWKFSATVPTTFLHSSKLYHSSTTQ